MNLPALSTEAREELIRRAWYIHDAAWFAALRARLGVDVANALNHQAVHAVGLAEARRLARRLGVTGVSDLDQLVDVIAVGKDVYVGDLMEMQTTRLSERAYELCVRRCFVAEHIAKAGLSEDYECAVFDRVAAWHEALGMPLTAEPARARCAVANEQECRRQLQVRGEQ